MVKQFLKKYWLPLLVFTLSGLIGGILITPDTLASYPKEIVDEIYAQGFNELAVSVITGYQYAVYGLVLGVLGIILAKKIGLWSDKLTFKTKPIIIAGIMSVIGGVSIIAFDLLWFGKEVQPIADSYIEKPSAATVIGSMILGGVVEEVMLRLFMMSLIAFAFLKIFKKTEKTEIFFILANLISSLLFAAGHLPATQMLLGLTPLIIFRCFLLNGGAGLMFGWLYRKHGLQYAVIAHAGFHLVSKLIWLIFI